MFQHKRGIRCRKSSDVVILQSANKQRPRKTNARIPQPKPTSEHNIFTNEGKITT